MRYTLAAAVVALLGVGLFLDRESMLQALGDLLVVQDELQPADVVHVIAGPDYRTDYAIRLYQEGDAKRIFFTGGWCRIHQYHHGERGRALALAQGVPQQAIATDESSVTSTYSEVVRLKEFMAESPEPIRSVIVVSDPYHMRRARWTYRRVLGRQVKVQMAPVPFELTPYKRRWWTDEASRQYVWDEYRKMVYYVARYRLAWGPLKEWLVSLDRE